MERPLFPYGISNFDKLVSENHVYVDRTWAIEHLERLSTSYHIFLRPRRFGKSLFLSVLEYYYGQEHRDKFERLFGRYYIGQQPTPRANQYLVLKFDFSAVLTQKPEQVLSEFTRRVQRQLLTFLLKYDRQ
ncbi:MAG: AAA family ATPase, partial [Saprospiraceae bacterium]|nr:AAA family ATPase [Saprospiraceae bacterium]